MYDSIEHSWYRYLQGHQLTFIANDPAQDFDLLADQHDCLIITGGDDSAVRRVTETRMAVAMLKRLRPILGVCHGSFLLTDMLGGSVKPCENHMDTEHNVHYKTEIKPVNSFHTQTIHRLHSSGTALAVDDDAHVEAWIDRGIAGMTWHPQRMTSAWIPNEISHMLNLLNFHGLE